MSKMVPLSVMSMRGIVAIGRLHEPPVVGDLERPSHVVHAREDTSSAGMPDGIACRFGVDSRHTRADRRHSG